MRDLVTHLKQKVAQHEPIIAAAVGGGLVAKSAVKGGIDFLLALSAGKYRQMGVGSLGSFLAYDNSNELVMEFATRELQKVAQNIPVVLGVQATDPTINLHAYIDKVAARGFQGINNFPSVGLIDGQFAEALEEAGMSYEQEVEAIRYAHEKGLFTVAFVFNEQQAMEMLAVGADIICVHLGLTVGGHLGAKRIQNLQSAKQMAQRIFERVIEQKPHVIRMIYGGIINKPIDAQFMMTDYLIQGYIGGSTFERIPTEYIVEEITTSFKQLQDFQYDDVTQKVIDGINHAHDYVNTAKKYIALYYAQPITLERMAQQLNISSTHLSKQFKKVVGISFQRYLIEYRMNRAVDLMKDPQLPLFLIAEMVGYTDYAQFSKMFKKVKGIAPKEYIKTTL